MGSWEALKKTSGTGWKELERESGTGWKALEWESAYEAFTTFTEVDNASDRIQKTANHIDFCSVYDENCRVYKDYGVGHFGDFTHKIKVEVTSQDTPSIGYTWVLTNELDRSWTLFNTGKTQIAIRFYRSAGGASELGLYETYSSSEYIDTYSGYSINTWYYIKIVKSGTSLNAYIYSDSDYSVLVDTLTLTLHANHTFRYLHGCNSWYTSSTYTMNLDIENFDIGE